MLAPPWVLDDVTVPLIAGGQFEADKEHSDESSGRHGP
jgi:hypothetical protein